MAKVLWAFAADQFIVDRSGKFSIIGIWEAVFAPNFPAIHPQVFIVAGWSGQASAQMTYEVRIWAPGNTLLITSAPTPFQLGPNGKGISVHQFAPVQLAQPGTYKIEILMNGVLAHTMELTAAVPPIPQGGQLGRA